MDSSTAMDYSITQRSSVAVAIPILSLIAILLSIVPLILHFKNCNFPSAYLVCWFILLSCFNIINAFIWPNDDVDSWWNGAGLCDIEVKLMIAGYVAVPGALLCIFRSLAVVLDTRRATLVPSKTQRWKKRSMDILFCVVVPVISMATHIVYQRSRYMILAITGCINDYDRSLASFLLSFVWPPVLCLIAAYYCGVVLYRLHKYRSQFEHIINSSNSHFNESRFMRLFILSFVMLLAILPVQLYVAYQNVVLSFPWHPYSWSIVHGADWNVIMKVPMHGQVFFDRWIPIGASGLVFVFFGCGRDATKMYCSVLASMGFGRCFPSLLPADYQPTQFSTASSSRTKLIFTRWSSTARTYVDSGLSSPTIDLEKGTQHQQSTPQRSLWSFLHHPFSQTRKPAVSTPRIYAPNTVSTSAWAGTSQSRCSSDLSDSTVSSSSSPSRKDFIRVKQVISQQSEMQV